MNESRPIDATHQAESSARSVMALSLVPELGPRRIRRLVSLMGGPERALDASMAQLESIPSIGRPLASRIARGLGEARKSIDQHWQRALDAGVKVLPYDDANFPSQLAGDEHAPAILYVRGSIDALARPGVGIVGSRKCSAYGLDQASRFAASLADAGWSIVSGGARGIDTAAHHAALRVNGSTVAILGCGLAHCYPSENAELFDRIVDSGGAVISELPMACAPDAKNFPARNRIIAGLATGVIVVEADQRSGALITARQAGEMGKEVMAIPGRIDVSTSKGCHDLIRDGVQLITSPQDVLDTLEPIRDRVVSEHLFTLPGSETPASVEGTDDDRIPNSMEDAILQALGAPMTLDQLCERVGLPPEQVRATVTLLEIRRRIRREGLRLVRNK